MNWFPFVLFVLAVIAFAFLAFEPAKHPRLLGVGLALFAAAVCLAEVIQTVGGRVVIH